jgi:hypothetical protein
MEKRIRRKERSSCTPFQYRASPESSSKNSILLSVSDQNKPSIVQSISKAYIDKVEINRASLLSLIDVVITLGKRNIAFRRNWNKETSEEGGNFMFFVNWKSSFDLVLKEHIEQKISYGKYLPFVCRGLIFCLGYLYLFAYISVQHDLQMMYKLPEGCHM